MTSLAHQLKRLALPQSDPSLLTRKEVASLLFDPKDAATMDRSTFYALGCTGLEELLGVEPAFLEFQNTLFNQASLTLERSIQSKKVNEKLDADVSLFLTRLSPYFLLKPAQKCIEWLVHRFHIQLYNVDSLLACALPYHETNVFVRVVQLLKISDPTNRWNWLHCLQKPGVPLAKGTLVTHCYKDLGFMDFICTIVTNSIKAYSEHSENCAQLRVIFSFYASTIVPALDAVEKISDTIISKLLPYVQKGLKSSLGDYKAATYMIICQLAVKVVMEASLVDTLASQISKSLVKEPVLAKEGLGCLIVLLQNQKDSKIGPRAFKRLYSMPSLVVTLQSMAVVHDVSPLLNYLLPHLVHAVISASSGETWLSVFKAILQSIPLTKGMDIIVLRLLLDEYLSQSQLSSEDITALNKRLLPLIRLFESKYCGAVDHVLAGHVSDITSAEQKHLFHQFISLSMSSGKFQILGDSNTSLLLSLQHPLPSVRSMAVDHLMAAITSGDENLDYNFLKGAVLDRMKDDVPEVVAVTLKALAVYMDRLDPEETASCLLLLLERTDLSSAGQWLPVLREAVRLLADPRLGKESSKLGQQIGWRLLPFTVITSMQPDSPELQLASCVAQSPILAHHPLTKGWSQELEKGMKRCSEPDFLGSVNQCLISTLSKNLASLERLSKRDALEKLALSLDQLRGSGLRERTAFLVLTQTLLEGLGQLSDTHHFLTAQKVYSLLEPPLLEATKEDAPQGAEGQVAAPVSFSEALALYIQIGRAGWGPLENRGIEYRLVLPSLLRCFISSLKCPDTFVKDEVCWNPEKLDPNTCCYLSLLCRLFDVIINSSTHGPMAISFRELMKLLLQVHLSEPLVLFKFLCVLWGYSANQGDQLDVKVTAILQTQALYMGNAMLSTQPASTLTDLASAKSPVVPSLLGCLSSPIREIRRAALNVLQTLSGSDTVFKPIVERLLKNTEEIIADPSHLSQALGVAHEECMLGKAKARKKKLLLSLEQLLQSIRAPGFPSYMAKTLLRALCQVNGESVLSVLLPVLDGLLEQSGPEPLNLLRDEVQLMQLVLGKYNEAAAPLLVKDQACLELFVRALRTPAQPYPDIPSFQIIALEQITMPFFSALGDEKVQQRLLGVMFNLLVESKSHLVANTISSVFKGIAVDGELVANELAPPEKPKVKVTVQQTRRSRLLHRKAQEGSEAKPEEGAMSWQRVTLILELLQHKKKLKRAQLLVPPLFALLARSLEPCAIEQGNMEYTKQLLLSCLLNVCQKLSPNGGPIAPDILDEDKFNVELVVQCVRVSDMPQTHHHALLLLGTVASIFPEKVLHNIMPIFTFMGANIMRLDDAYSFQVINKTVQTVIPALIKTHEGSEDKSSSHMEAVVTQIMHVFVDAVPHMPEHRRPAILSQLMNTLGPGRFLWVLMLLQFKQHATQTANSGKRDAALERDMEFWISLCCEFEVSDQLTSLIKILQYLMQLPKDKENATAAPVKHTPHRRAVKIKRDEKAEEPVFNVDAHSGKELRHFKFLSVSFMAQLLASSSFIAKVADNDDAGNECLQQLQQSLLEEILLYIHSVAHCVEENAESPTAKFWRVLLNKTYDVLDKVNALLPADTFITVMKGLMGNQLPSVRRKAMELLNNKLQHRTHWKEQQVTVLLQLTGDLLDIVRKGKSKAGEECNGEEEQAINRQTALYSLKLLCRNFGSNHSQTFVPVLMHAVDIVMSPEEDKNVMGSALLCIAEVTSRLKALAIPQLPRLMPAVLYTLTDRKDLLSNEIYLLSAVTALQRVTETLAHFISPYLQDITLQVCRLTRLAETTTSPQLSVRLTSLKNTLATKVPPRVLMPTITKCYSNIVTKNQTWLGPLMTILKEHICHIEKEQLNSHQSELTSFFLTTLDFRAQHCQGDLEKTKEIEGYVIDCLLAMVMKLSEVTFRPLFFKVFDWSKNEADGKERLLTFYRLADCIADRLKGLFVLFAGNLVKPFADLLRQTNISKTDDLLFDSEENVEKSSLLLEYILDCLHKIFLYDTQHFLSKERADALLGPLVDQLDNMLGGDEVYQTRVAKHLVPCIAQFSVAMGDDSQWKALNYQVLLKTRHTSSKVRFSSLLVLLELAGKLKENYMVLLPETIPFLAELMEDECEEVEHQVQKVIQEMENILGEPLQSYF
ncbi:HEAT repeat-containing protein 1 [Lampris incognitus]|uniref:HEAT repeat-containing protein 1 n=1 Tax=Lampris incognitus TaxID=2546036 RepID=UPI0024B60C98|nr:HEAT repeat-containing protein 1 [Lampris incognitus]